MSKQRFADVAETLHANGYNITPLHGKHPIIDNWAALYSDGLKIEKWLQKYTNANVGVLTRRTPAIDIDIYDPDAAAEMQAWCLDNLSDIAPVRVGQAPKCLLLFRTETPFRKMKETWVDGAGQEHAIEILGDGQQFVAFGTHPDTKKPFSWVSIDSPLDVAVDDLPELTQADAARVLEALAAMAQRRGWKRKGSKALTTASPNDDFGDDDSDALLGASGKADDLDDADIRDALSLIDIDACDYDRWLTVGMALHHQYDGAVRGMELWDEWSTESEHYDYDEIKDKWASFSVVRRGGKPTTIATVLKWAKEGAKQKTKEGFDLAVNAITTCTDVDELFDSVARTVGKLALLPHQLQTAAIEMQKRMVELSGIKMPIADIRKTLTNASKGRSAKESVPEWVEDFVWIEGDDRFYSLSERKALSIKSYNARYDENMLSPEEKTMKVAVPATRAADAAFTLYRVRRADGMIYLPGCDQIVQFGHGETYVNTYDDRDVPEIRKPTTEDEKAALDAVKFHFRTLLPDDRERSILLSFFAYHVQSPMNRVNWAPLMQGVEGAGKTWMQNFMAAVLGPKNVKPIKPTSLFADFNGWAEGAQMAFIEEIRLRGHERYEVLDKIKDIITNDSLEITRKGKDPVTRPNTQSYVLLTNWQDALALSDNDRRYLILRTMLQNKRDLKAFLAEHPGHFTRIFNAIAEHPGVMRWWLSRFKLHEEFDPEGHAPDTESKRLMAELTGSDEQDAVMLLIERSEHPDCNEYLLNVTKMPSRLRDLEGEFVVPQTRALKAMLEQMGFTFLGKIRVDGAYQRFYTRRPDLFRGRDLAAVSVAVRRLLDGEEPEFV